MYSPAWLEHEILGNPVLTWGISIAVFLAAGALLVVARRAITRWLRALRRRRQLAHDPGEVAATDLLRLLLKACVWVVIGLLMLDNLGINITALVAGFAEEGIEFAFPTQTLYVAGLGTEPQLAPAERSGKVLRNRESPAH